MRHIFVPILVLALFATSSSASDADALRALMTYAKQQLTHYFTGKSAIFGLYDREPLRTKHFSPRRDRTCVCPICRNRNASLFDRFKLSPANSELIYFSSFASTIRNWPSDWNVNNLSPSSYWYAL
jgi:hypothetical protein